MKKYDGKLKKWVSVEEYERRMNKRDTKLCRAKKPHNFVLVLPNHVTFNNKYKFNPEDYYRIINEIHEFEEKQFEALENMGIISRYKPWPRKETRFLICSVCKKQKYEYD